MERRKFLIGAGSLAAGGAAATGTGAFASQSDRDTNIQTVTDDKALIALRDTTDGKIIRQKGGELYIDFTAGGNAGGINTDSQYQIGTMPPSTPGSADPLETGDTVPDAFDDPAFKIVNQTTQDKKLSLEVVPDSIPGGQLVFGLSTDRVNNGSGFAPNSDVFGIGIEQSGGGGPSQGDTANVEVGEVGVNPGNQAAVAILVNADQDPATSNRDEVAPGTDLSAELRITAEDV